MISCDSNIDLDHPLIKRYSIVQNLVYLFTSHSLHIVKMTKNDRHLNFPLSFFNLTVIHDVPIVDQPIQPLFNVHKKILLSKFQKYDSIQNLATYIVCSLTTTNWPILVADRMFKSASTYVQHCVANHFFFCCVVFCSFICCCLHSMDCDYSNHAV